MENYIKKNAQLIETQSFCFKFLNYLSFAIHINCIALYSQSTVFVYL